MKRRILLGLVFVVIRISASASELSLRMENDLLNDSDKFYTHGTRITYVSNPTKWADNIMDKLPFFNDNGVRSYGYTVGQNMYTPTNISMKIPDPDDRPYAGWLYGGVIFKTDHPDVVDFLEIDIGMIGPHSYAEQTQKFIHMITGSNAPQGWDSQIGDELGIVLLYKRKWKGDLFNNGLLEGQFNPYTGFSLGNVATYGQLGYEFRFGYNLPKDVIGHSDISQATIERGVGKKNFCFFVFSGMEARIVARNIFLDGNTFKDSPSVCHEPMVGDWKTGISIGVGRFSLDYCHVIRTKEFETETYNDFAYDSIGITWAF
jgi:hypothetical protein